MNPTANEKWAHNGTIHWSVVSTQQPLTFQGLCLYITMSHEKIKPTQSGTNYIPRPVQKVAWSIASPPHIRLTEQTKAKLQATPKR